MTSVPEVNISFRGLKMWANMSKGLPFCSKNYNKMILKNINGDFKAGTSTAILGPSGSGKTTFLNFIASRMTSGNLEVEGELFINGNKIKSIKEMKHRFSYVMQEDVLFSDLSVYEILISTARLAGLPKPQEAVDEVIKWLNLEGCKHTKVGSSLDKGISGGEAKRTSIAVEMLTQPSVIFLDEPTTGLDSKSALDVAAIIKMFARNGRTCIATIHQPSSEIMMKFDHVLCICKGEIVYYGPPKHIPDHFSSIGYAPPMLTNPADHLMTILNDDDIRIRALKENRQISNKEVQEEF